MFLFRVVFTFHVCSFLQVDDPYFNEPGFESSMHSESGKAQSRAYSANIMCASSALCICCHGRRKAHVLYVGKIDTMLSETSSSLGKQRQCRNFLLVAPSESTMLYAIEEQLRAPPAEFKDVIQDHFRFYVPSL